MLGVKFSRTLGSLTHLSPFRLKTRTFDNLHTLTHLAIPPRRTKTQHLAMASTPQDDPKWTSRIVRDTFLQYFQKHGHTFGMCEGDDNNGIDNMRTRTNKCYPISNSCFICCRTAIGSHPALYERGDESV